MRPIGFIAGFLLAIVIVAIGFSNYTIADFKSTFLIGTADYSTLSWLSDDQSPVWRDKVLAQIQGNGDTHADVMARSYDSMGHHGEQGIRSYWMAVSPRSLG
jgi:hypothetical protein